MEFDFLSRAEIVSRAIGSVLQESVLFNRSIRENIAFADPGIAMERVMAAADLAGPMNSFSSFRTAPVRARSPRTADCKPRSRPPGIPDRPSRLRRFVRSGNDPSIGFERGSA